MKVALFSLALLGAFAQAQTEKRLPTGVMKLTGASGDPVFVVDVATQPTLGFRASVYGRQKGISLHVAGKPLAFMDMYAFRLRETRAPEFRKRPAYEKDIQAVQKFLQARAKTTIVEQLQDQPHFTALDEDSHEDGGLSQPSYIVIDTGLFGSVVQDNIDFKDSEHLERGYGSVIQPLGAYLAGLDRELSKLEQARDEQSRTLLGRYLIVPSTNKSIETTENYLKILSDLLPTDH